MAEEYLQIFRSDCKKGIRFTMKIGFLFYRNKKII